MCGLPAGDDTGGLSPRGRGKLRLYRAAHGGARSIPAWAGETLSPHPWWAIEKVYPRVGGGNRQFALRRAPAYGLSPRGRGKRISIASARAWRGSIPAWAGETAISSPPCVNLWVYPRVGGGNHNELADLLLSIGLSPRGRGKHVQALL